MPWSRAARGQGETRARRLGTLAKDRRDFALTPFLYEHSGFHRSRFDRLGLLPSDIQTVDALPRWPVVDKAEMKADAAEHSPVWDVHDEFEIVLSTRTDGLDLMTVVDERKA